MAQDTRYRATLLASIICILIPKLCEILYSCLITTHTKALQSETTLVKHLSQPPPSHKGSLRGAGQGGGGGHPPCSDLLGSSDCNSRCRNNNVLANQLFPPSDLSVYLNNAIRNVNISAIYI